MCSPSSEGGVMLKRGRFNVFLSAAGLLVLVRAAVRDGAAQTTVITGKVVGRGGDPLGGALGAIEQYGLAAATTTAGAYTLTIPPQWRKGQTLMLGARSIGYSPALRQSSLTPRPQNGEFHLKIDPYAL